MEVLPLCSLQVFPAISSDKRRLDLCFFQLSWCSDFHYGVCPRRSVRGVPVTMGFQTRWHNRPALSKESAIVTTVHHLRSVTILPGFIAVALFFVKLFMSPLDVFDRIWAGPGAAPNRCA